MCSEEDLAGRSAIDVGRFIRDVDSIKEHLQVVSEAVARTNIDLIVLVNIGRRNTTHVGLPRTREELVSPVVGNTNREAVLLVEADQVGRITDTRHNKLLGQQHVIVRGLGVDKGRVGNHTEPAATEVMLQIQFPAIYGVLVLIRGDDHIKDRLWVTRLTRDDAICSVNAW